MRIELGAHVWTQDGKEAGKVSQLVVDPSQQTLDSFVVHTQWMGQDLIVPIRNIERVDADDTIHLTITDERFRALPQYFVTEFVSNPSAAGQSIMPASSFDIGARTSVGYQFDPSGGPLIGIKDPTGEVYTTASSLSDNEFSVSKGTHVMSVDGHHVGSVHELSVTDEGKLRGLVVTSGHIMKHQHLVPINEIGDADTDAVYLRMTAAEFQHLEQMSQSENEQP